jgi:hypothetical protein
VLRCLESENKLLENVLHAVDGNLAECCLGPEYESDQLMGAEAECFELDEERKLLRRISENEDAPCMGWQS